MLHFSCDICGKDLAIDSRNRFVVKLEAYAAQDPTELTDEDTDADQVEEMARLLTEQEETGDDSLEPMPVCKKLRYDLCSHCYRKFTADPLGRENVRKFNFSAN